MAPALRMTHALKEELKSFFASPLVIVRDRNDNKKLVNLKYFIILVKFLTRAFWVNRALEPSLLTNSAIDISRSTTTRPFLCCILLVGPPI